MRSVGTTCVLDELLPLLLCSSVWRRRPQLRMGNGTWVRQGANSLSGTAGIWRVGLIGRVSLFSPSGVRQSQWAGLSLGRCGREQVQQAASCRHGTSGSGCSRWFDRLRVWAAELARRGVAQTHAGSETGCSRVQNHTLFYPKPYPSP